MTCAFTKPTVVPTASAWIGTSFWRTVVTRTSGGGGAGGSALLQALPKAIASMASVAATTRDALEPSMTNSIPDLSEPQHFKGRDPGGERRPRRELVHRLAGCVAPDALLRIEDDPDWIGGELAAAHPPIDRLARGHVIDLQLDAAAIGILVVHRGRRPVVDAPERLDAFGHHGLVFSRTLILAAAER